MYTGHPDQYFGHISYSQHGEDLMLLNLFKQIGIDKPSYLDLGAHHPTNISNTALMYSRGCRGVNIEANPNLMEAFYKERSEDKNVCVGVGLKEDDMPFFMFDERSGLNTFSEAQAMEITKSSGMIIQNIKLISCMTLNQIVDTYCEGKFPDFLSCDIEGLDIEVLAHADFSKNKPKVMCVEIREVDMRRSCLMIESNGYNSYCRMGENVIFVQDEYLKRL